MKSESERIEEIEKMPLKEFREKFETLTEFSARKGYKNSNWVRQKLGEARRRGVEIGIYADRLNIPALIKSALLFEKATDSIIAEEIMDEKQQAGRKSNEKDSEGEV